MSSHTMKPRTVPVAFRSLVVSLALLAAGGGAWAQAAVAASGPAPVALRQALAEPLQAAHEAIKANDPNRAQALLRQAEAVADRTAQENYHLARVKVPVALALNDHVAALQALELSLASPELPAADRLPLLEAAVGVAWRAKAPERAEALARDYFKAGGASESVRTVLVQALNQRGAAAEMLAELDLLIAADEKAGRKVAEARWKLQAIGRMKLGDEAGYADTLAKLVRDYPSTAYWRDLVARTEARPGFAERLTLETLRLLRHVGALTEADEFTRLAELAQRAGQPAEALAVVDDGLQRKLLGQGAQAPAHQALRERFAKAAADDRARLAAGRADAEKAKDGALLMALGQVHGSLGEWDVAVALMAQGLQKGVARQPEDARLRYGATLMAAGQRETALAVLQTVRGDDGTAALARLWTLVGARR